MQGADAQAKGKTLDMLPVYILQEIKHGEKKGTKH